MCQWEFPVDEPVLLPSYRRRPGESIGLIAERIRNGTSIRALASEYGVSRETIRRALARVGVAIEVERESDPSIPLRRVRAHRLPGRGRSQAFTPHEVTALLARHDGGESIRSLARATGVSHEAMRQTLARTGRAARASCEHDDTQELSGGEHQEPFAALPVEEVRLPRFAIAHPLCVAEAWLGKSLLLWFLVAGRVAVARVSVPATVQGRAMSGDEYRD